MARVTKDLFVRLFDDFSGWPFEFYQRHFLERLPFRLLSPAESVNVDLASCQGYEELRDLLRSPDNRHWKNPELYPFLNYLNIPDAPALQEAVDALRVHLVLDPLTQRAQAIRRLWRLRSPKACVYEFVEEEIRPLEDICLAHDDTDFGPVIYRPYCDLFSDLNQQHYRAENSLSTIECSQLLSDALGLLYRYSPEIYESFCRQIATVAFMPRSVGRAKSFSLRNYFVGGVFVSVSDRLTLAEQLLHEYYHQCMWPWWLINEPPDLPRAREIISPVSAQSRNVPAMLQAALIYKSLLDFYTFALPLQDVGYLAGTDIQYSTERCSQIAIGLPQLIDQLHNCLADCPISSTILDSIASYN